MSASGGCVRRCTMTSRLLISCWWAWFSLCLVPAQSLLAAGPDAFEWYRALEAPFESGAMYRVNVTADLYDLCRQFPHDLRIIDGAGVQWPFFRRRPKPRTASPPHPVEIVNRAWFAGDDSTPAYYRLDLRVQPTADGERRLHNRIELKTPGHDFIRRVEVFGAETPGEWGLLGAGYLVRHRAPRRDENMVTYSAADYPELQIRVYPNVRNALEEVTVQDVHVRSAPSLSAQLTRVIAHERLPTPRAELDPNAQIEICDAGYQRHPVAHVTFQVEDGAFLRRTRLYTRDTMQEKWRPAGSGDLYRLGGRAQLQIEANGAGRNWKIHIDHYDNQPLTIHRIDLHAPRVELLVEALSTGPVALYYGSDRVNPPRYDLEARWARQQIDVAGLPLLTLGPRQANPGYRRHPMQPLLPWLIPLAVAMASTVVVVVIFRMWKQTSGKDGP